MRFAYADPPYIGMAHRYPEKTEVDHPQLIRRLVDEYPEGWALSLSSVTLGIILPMCPADVRVMAWVKPFAVFRPNVGVAYAWEPVIVHGGRKRTREQLTVRDWVSAPITLERGVVGAKPEAFCRWLLEVLNYQSGDTIDDIFPGTGVLGEVLAQERLAL